MRAERADDAALAYNYKHFDAYVETGLDDEEFGGFRDMLHAGDRAPDGELYAFDEDATVRLSELWATRGIILEFGSFA